MKDIKIVILSGIILIMLTANVLLIGKSRDPDELVLRKLVIVDEQGRERITLTAWNEFAAINILDSDGQPLARLEGKIPDEKRFSSARLELAYPGRFSCGIKLDTFMEPEIKLIGYYGDAVSIDASRTKRLPAGTYDVQSE